MRLQLDEDEQLIVDSVAELVAKSVTPKAEAWDGAERIDAEPEIHALARNGRAASVPIRLCGYSSHAVRAGDTQIE